MAEFEKTGDWDKARAALAGLDRRVVKAIDKALFQEAQYIRKEIVAGFQGGGPLGVKWVALSPTTLATRRFDGFRGTKILIRSGDLRNAIALTGVRKIDGGYFIGVARGAPRKDGKAAINVALVQEFGADFRMTLSPKQLRYLFAAMRAARIPPRPSAPGGRGGPVTVHIRIPPRPFIGPVYDALARPGVIDARIMKRVADNLNKQLGDIPGTAPK